VNRKELIAAARGDGELDLAITNASLVNVFTCEIYPADIGIFGDRIALVGPAGQYELQARQHYDASGKWAVPGFIDPHIHIESSMVTPSHYGAAVLPRGTTTSIIDPHEIGNAFGKEGIRYMLEAGQDTPLRVYVAVPSCVPSVPGKETTGADLSPEDVSEMLTWPGVIGVAEVMDYMGVINGSPKMLGIVQAGLEAGVNIQGHAPMLRGRLLNAYLAAGIESDHETMLPEECLEKLRLGMLPFLRVASYGSQLPAFLPVITSLPFLEVALCTDDVMPEDLLDKGHLDRAIREAISFGIEPAQAIRWATLNPARHYRLRDHGGIAPGFLADLLLLSSLEDVAVSEVIVGGRFVVEGGRFLEPVKENQGVAHFLNSIRLQPLSEKTFELRAPVEEGSLKVNVIEMQGALMTSLSTLDAEVVKGFVDPQALGEDICLLTVVPRYGQTHQPVVVPLKGLGLKHGAIATSVAHDAHNIIVAGKTAADMLHAVRELEASGGGIVLVDAQQVLAKVELPVAGLMSLKSVPEVAGEMRQLNQAAVSAGIPSRFGPPAMILSGLALIVIPEVRVSDLGGLFHVERQEFLPVFP
jgi:adenine deaminase